MDPKIKDYLEEKNFSILRYEETWKEYVCAQHEKPHTYVTIKEDAPPEEAYSKINRAILLEEYRERIKTLCEQSPNKTYPSLTDYFLTVKGTRRGIEFQSSHWYFYSGDPLYILTHYNPEYRIAQNSVSCSEVDPEGYKALLQAYQNA